MSILCILPGPSHIYATEPDDRQDRWCYICRKRPGGRWELIGDPPGVMTYYDNQWTYRCNGCGDDGRYFPGCGPL